jgi:hypothetical protein
MGKTFAVVHIAELAGNSFGSDVAVVVLGSGFVGTEAGEGELQDR